MAIALPPVSRGTHCSTLQPPAVDTTYGLEQVAFRERSPPHLDNAFQGASHGGERLSHPRQSLFQTPRSPPGPRCLHRAEAALGCATLTPTPAPGILEPYRMGKISGAIATEIPLRARLGKIHSIRRDRRFPSISIVDNNRPFPWEWSSRLLTTPQPSNSLWIFTSSSGYRSGKTLLDQGQKA